MEESYNQTGVIDLLKVALLKTHSGTHGFEFEEFIQELLVCQYGDDVIPSSPFKDGGIDAFIQRIDGDKVFPLLNKQTTIVQISTTEDTESKIKKTIEELKKQSKNFNLLLYFTSREVSNVDSKEESLEEAYPGIRIKIKTATHLALNYAAMYPKVCKRFNTKMLGFQSSDSKRYLKIDYTPLYLHIWQHHTNAQAMEDLKTNMADGLIIWALKDTNPDEKKFLTNQEIYQAIEQEFPSSKHVIKSIIPQRIKFLSKRRTQKHRQQMIQVHKGNKYCLPYETREEYMFIEEKNNALFELIKLGFTKRFRKYGVSDELKIAKLNDLTLYALKSLFEKYGMSFYHFLEDSNGKSVTFNINDAVQLAIDDDFQASTYSKNDVRIVSMTIHDMINEPDENQKELLNNLKHLFILHVLMKNDMQLAKFFNTVSDELILYVNSDILIRAITERYVEKEGQRYRNILKFLNETKAELRVTQFTINEVIYNIRAADWEFKNHLQSHESLFDRYTASMLPKIMNRAYFYSKLDGKVSNWRKFINNFCTYSTLHTPEHKAFEEIKKYITDSFRLKYFSEEEMVKNIKCEIFEKLTNELKPYKKTVDIAKGVVATVLNIKYDREQNREYLNDSLLGYRTWWLTEEVRSYGVLKKSLEDRKFAMRPDFIIDTLMMTPSSRDIKKSYANTFTTTLGVQMAKQLSKETLAIIMKEMAELSEYEEPRVKAMFTDIFEQAAEISKPNKEDEMYECTVENEDTHDEHIEWKEKILEIIENSKKRHIK